MGGEGKAAGRAPSERILRCVSEGAGAPTQPSSSSRRAENERALGGGPRASFAEEDFAFQWWDAPDPQGVTRTCDDLDCRVQSLLRDPQPP
jgi:hypothetical protein